MDVFKASLNGDQFQSPFEEKVVSIMICLMVRIGTISVFQSPFEEKVVSIRFLQITLDINYEEFQSPFEEKVVSIVIEQLPEIKG